MLSSPLSVLGRLGNAVSLLNNTAVDTLEDKQKNNLSMVSHRVGVVGENWLPSRVRNKQKTNLSL
jgi:hypothetical protein